jgi:hypothetical protein
MQRAQGVLGGLGGSGGGLIADAEGPGTSGLAIGQPFVFQVGPSAFQQAGRGETFIGKYENRGNR